MKKSFERDFEFRFLQSKFEYHANNEGFTKYVRKDLKIRTNAEIFFKKRNNSKTLIFRNFVHKIFFQSKD